MYFEKITEPEFPQYDKYIYHSNNNFKNKYNEILRTEEYMGRLTYYNIILN